MAVKITNNTNQTGIEKLASSKQVVFQPGAVIAKIDEDINALPTADEQGLRAIISNLLMRQKQIVAVIGNG